MSPLDLLRLTLDELTDIINSPRMYDPASEDLLQDVTLKAWKATARKFVNVVQTGVPQAGAAVLLLGESIMDPLNVPYFYGFVNFTLTDGAGVLTDQQEVAGLVAPDGQPIYTFYETTVTNPTVPGYTAQLLSVKPKFPILFQQFIIASANGSGIYSFTFQGLQISKR